MKDRATITPLTHQLSDSPAYARAEILTGYLELTEKLGLNGHDLLARVKLTPNDIADANHRVNYHSIRELFQISADTSKTPFFGLLFAQHQPIATIGIAGDLANLSQNLRQAITSSFKYMHLHSEGSSWHFEETNSTAYIYRKERFPHRFAMDQLAIYNLAKLCLGLRTLFGNNWSPNRVLFDFARPDNSEVLQRFFNTALQFDQEHPGLILPARYLDEPLNLTASNLHKKVELNAQALMAKTDTQLDLVDQIKALIIQDISSGRWSAATIAAKLSMHPKALQRQLAARGIRFRDLENTIKMDVSQRYLLTTENSISEISSLLGYGSLSAFTRAFKKQTGVSPNHWRRTNR